MAVLDADYYCFDSAEEVIVESDPQERESMVDVPNINEVHLQQSCLHIQNAIVYSRNEGDSRCVDADAVLRENEVLRKLCTEYCVCSISSFRIPSDARSRGDFVDQMKGQKIYRTSQTQ